MSTRDDDVASQAALALTSLADGDRQAATTKAQRVSDKYADDMHYINGDPILCDACHAAKPSADLALPSDPRWWITHGRPDPGGHSSCCGYCDTTWMKQYYTMTKPAAIEYFQTEEGKSNLAYFTGKLVDLRKDKGGGCRISKKQLEDWVANKPAEVFRDNTDTTEMEEPPDIWVTEQEHLDDHGSKPSVQGITCIWIKRPNGNREFGYWKQSTGPLKRVRKNTDSVTLREGIDHSDLAMSDDQLARRFAAEADSLRIQSPQSVLLKDLARLKEVKPASVTGAQPAPTIAPLGRSLLASILGSSAVEQTAAGTKRRAASASTGPQSPAEKKAKFQGGPSSSPSPKLAIVGGTPRGAGPLSQAMMYEQYNDCDGAMASFQQAKTNDELMATEAVLKKAIGGVDKKKVKLQMMPMLDQTHLDFQLRMDDYSAKLATCQALLVEYRKCAGGSTSGKKEKAAPGAGAGKMSKLAASMKEYSHLFGELPSVFRELDWQIRADDHAGKLEISEFVTTLEAIDQSELSCNPVTFVEDFTLFFFVRARGTRTRYTHATSKQLQNRTAAETFSLDCFETTTQASRMAWKQKPGRQQKPNCVIVSAKLQTLGCQSPSQIRPGTWQKICWAPPMPQWKASEQL